MNQKIISRLSLSDYNLTVLDEIGWHLPMQLVVICNGQYDLEQLKKINVSCFHTPLGKLKKISFLPFTRDYWIPLPENKIPDVDADQKPITEAELPTWLDNQITAQFKVTEQAGWKISVANLTDNRYVISLVILHQLIDGQGAYGIVKKLHTGQDQRLVASQSNNLVADLKDAKKYFTRLFPYIALKWVSRGTMFAHKRLKSSPFTIDPWKTFLFDLTEIEKTASDYGGSVTSLGIALTANVDNAILDRKHNESIYTPVKGEDDRSNSVKVAAITLKDLPSPITSLSEIKPLAKAAYSQSSYSMKISDRKKSFSFYSNAGTIPTEIISMFPDAITVFAKASVWHKNNRLNSFIKGALSFTTNYQNIFALTVTSVTGLNSAQLQEKVEQELARFGLKAHTVI